MSRAPRDRRSRQRGGVAPVALGQVSRAAGRLMVLATAATMLAAPAGAQMRRSTMGAEPAWWLSGGVGIASPGEVRDGRTRSTWRFGEDVQYRAGVEASLGGNAAVGVTAAYARVPLTYVSNAPVVDPIGSERTCAGCDAEADLWSLLASFHAGGGQGFHQVVEVSAGWTRFMNFRRTDTGAELAPDGDTDLAFSLGYGFGYGVSARTQLVLVQDFAFVLHQREGLSGGDRTLVRQSVTRVGLRMGAGARRR